MQPKKTMKRRNGTTRLFDSIVIIGPGLIGGSFGMAVRAKGLAGRVTGVGHRIASLEEAKRLGAVDEFTLEGREAVASADLVVLATGIGTLCAQVREFLPLMKRGSILTDVGSVKTCVCRAASGAERNGALFIGGHPLAGSEQRGIAAARVDLFQGSLCILTPTPTTDRRRAALRQVRALWKALGCAVRVMPPDRHDRLLAEISHLPHVAASCLVNAVSDKALAVAARGFMDTTRVASGDPALWRDICDANRKALAPALRSLAKELNGLADNLDSGNAQAVLKKLQRAKERRDRRNGIIGNGE